MKMEMLEKLSPEVLIYMQNVRRYFTSNEETKEYFQIDTYGDEFFDKITELSQKNFKEYGVAELTLEQFEEVRRKVSDNFVTKGVFLSVGNFGLISLN